jgi:molybdate transport system substrate-binding protein
MIRREAVMLIVLLLAAAACTPRRQAPTDDAGSPSRQPTLDDAILVSVAASTRNAVEELAAQFSSKSGVEVKVNAASSSRIANQILAGAPVDIFLSANRQWAEAVREAGEAEAAAKLLTNRLVIVVPPGNPAQVHEPEDLLSAGVRFVALAGENVPAGDYAEQALGKLSLLEPLTKRGRIARGQDVRGALAFVERGEAEAGIVYATDVLAAPRVEVVHEFDPALHDEIVYMLVLLKHGEQKPAARQFYEFVQSPEAALIFGRFGFSRLPVVAGRSGLH